MVSIESIWEYILYLNGRSQKSVMVPALVIAGSVRLVEPRLTVIQVGELPRFVPCKAPRE